MAAAAAAESRLAAPFMSRNLPTSPFLISTTYFLRHFLGFLVSHCIVTSNGAVNTKANMTKAILVCTSSPVFFFLLLMLAFFICKAPETLAAKAHCSQSITTGPLGILTEKNTTESSHRFLRPAEFSSVLKITTRLKINLSSANYYYFYYY